MKKTITILFLSLFTTAAFSQVPQTLNYQAVARNNAGQIIASQGVGLRFTILDGSSTGTQVYQEIQSLSTNTLGLFTAIIGNGNPNGFITIEWGTGGSKWLQVELDANGGTNYSLIGTSQLLSVPYALYAEKAGRANSSTLAVPHGTDNIIPVIDSISSDLSRVYSVPLGKTLYITYRQFYSFFKTTSSTNFEVTNPTLDLHYLMIPAGISFYSSNGPNVPYLKFYGFLADDNPNITSLLLELSNSQTYIVPAGKILILKHPEVYSYLKINGQPIGNFSSEPGPVLVPSNSIISTNSAQIRGFLGYLK